MEFVFADIARLGEIEQLEHDNLTNPWNITQLKDFVSCGGKILTLVINDKIVGYISFKIILDEAEINNLAVELSCRQKGYGVSLLERAEQFMSENSVVNVFLEVSEHNKVAIKLYQNQNYSQYGIRKNYYVEGDNALLMRKTLNKM